MNITLRFQGRAQPLPIPTDGWQSHGKGSEQYAFVAAPHLPPPFRDVFFKRYLGKVAPAHDLLLRLHGEGLRCRALPLFLGYAADGPWHYYAFMRLHGCHLLSRVTGNRKAPHGQTLSPLHFVRVLNASVTAFSFLNREGYYYADYTFENMLLHPHRGAVILIDVDSAFPFERAATPADCRQTWWTLFVAEGLDRFEYLNATMLMSMALVTAVATAALHRRGAGANVADILRARPDQQREYFRLLRESDTAALARLFLPAAVTRQRLNSLCVRWNESLDAMRRGAPVSWRNLIDLAIVLFALADPGGGRYARKSPQPPLSTPVFRPAAAQPPAAAVSSAHSAKVVGGGVFPAFPLRIPLPVRAAASALLEAARVLFLAALARFGVNRREEVLPLFFVLTVVSLCVLLFT